MFTFNQMSDIIYSEVTYVNRDKIIVRTSIIGILANVFLASFKAVIGFLSSSIAIILDSVNNLSDVMSSLITIIGTKLANKSPDKEHPYGHGRIEYISTVLIAFLVLYAGIASLSESVKKIINPMKPEYKAVSLMIIAVAVAVKILLGLYYRKMGDKVASSSLTASGTDALMDSVVSFSTLIAALVYIITGVSLEAWLGAVISLIIIKSGFSILKESFSAIIGQRTDKAISDEICATIAEFDEVYGVYDLVLHSYGPETLIGSVHIEIPDTLTICELDRLERNIGDAVREKHRVILAGISIYSKCMNDNHASAVHNDIRKIVMSHENVLQFHGFFLDEISKKISFDIIIDFAAPDGQHIYEKVCDEVKQKYPDYTIDVTLDLDL